MRKLALFILIGIGTYWSANAQNVQPVDENGIALGGYDVVAYFSNQALRGHNVYSYQYKDATYLFSSALNRDTFRKTPEKFLPQYDGYCAWGVAAKSAKFPVNPETYDIIEGKLYLFYNGDFNGKPFNTKTLWLKETATLRAAADEKWPTIQSK